MVDTPFTWAPHPAASKETVVLNEPHAPHPNAIEAYNQVLHDIKSAILKSRHDWNKVYCCPPPLLSSPLIPCSSTSLRCGLALTA